MPMACVPSLHILARAVAWALLLVAAFGVAPARADAELRVALRSKDISSSLDLGSVEIEGLGAVRVHARREGQRMILHASGPDGRVLGRGETTVGLNETPIFVPTPDGHEKITVLWGSLPADGQ